MSHLISLPRLPLSSHQGAGLHLVRGDDVRLHRRAAGVARDRDGLLLQEDIGGGGGGPERERVSTPMKHCPPLPL